MSFVVRLGSAKNQYTKKKSDVIWTILFLVLILRKDCPFPPSPPPPLPSPCLHTANFMRNVC